LGFAVDKYIYHSISKFPSWLFEHRIRFAYKVVEHVVDLNDIKHIPFREILRFHNIDRDIEVNLASDLPSFTGLGSSSSFTVGLIKGLHAFEQQTIGSKELASLAIHLERNILNEAVGLQDQIFASYGGFNKISFFGHNNFNVERVILNSDSTNRLSKNLFLIFTQMTRRASEVEIKKLEKIQHNIPNLKELNKICDEAFKVLTGSGDIDDLGLLLNENWRLKRSLSDRVSNTTIDSIYQLGLESGASGGKLLGAGGGGFFLFYVPAENHRKFLEGMSAFHVIDFEIGASGSTIIHYGS